MHGGFCAVSQGNILASLALPVAGLMSTECMETVSQNVDLLAEDFHKLGNSYLENPVSRITILNLLVCPYVKLSDHGLVMTCLLYTSLGVLMGYTGDLIQFITFGVLRGTRTGWPIAIAFAAFYFALYYFIFKWSIQRFDIKTPGREEVMADVYKRQIQEQE